MTTPNIEQLRREAEAACARFNAIVTPCDHPFSYDVAWKDAEAAQARYEAAVKEKQGESDA
jgi:hypothetical protein